jgi:O-antigen/teichoic acid export membrane protein
MSARSKIDTYLRGTGASVASTVVQKATGFASVWLLNQVLIKANYGDYAFSLTVISLLLLVGSGGFNQGVLYRLSRRQDEDGEGLIGREYVGIALGWSLVLALVVLVGVNVGARYWLTSPDEQRIAFWLSGLSLLIPLKVASLVYKAWYQAHQRIPEALFFHKIVPFTCKAGFLALVWQFRPTPSAVIGSVVLSEVVPVAWWYLRSPVSPFLFYKGLARLDVAYSLKLALTSGLSKSASRTDVFMLGVLGGGKATAEYVIASKFAVLLTNASQNVFDTVLRPRMGQLLGQQKRDRLEREYDQIRLLSLVIALLVAALYVVIGRGLLSLFGAYAVAYPVLLILSAKHVIQVSFGKNGAYLKMAGYAGWAMSTVAMLLSLNVALNWLLIPLYGAAGAAMATAISGLTLGAFRTVLIYRLDNMRIYSASLVGFVSVAVSAFLLAARGAVKGIVAGGALLLVVGGLLLWNRQTLEPAMRRVVSRGRKLVER